MQLGEKSFNRLLDIHKAAHYMGVSTTTLYKWVSHRKIPYIKNGQAGEI